MQTEETRTLIQTYYDTLEKSDPEKLAALFTEDVEWHPPESAPIEPLKGREAVSKVLAGELIRSIFDTKTFRVDVHRILADGSTGIVQQHLSAKTLQGVQYENEYCWIYHCRDGQIAKIEEYNDTHKAARIMGWED